MQCEAEKTLRIILDDYFCVMGAKYALYFALIFFLFFTVCSVRVIGESDIMQEFLSESDEVSRIKTLYLQY